MLILHPHPLPPPLTRDSVENGACVIFEGRVRGSSKGRAVKHLDYEAFEPLAMREFENVEAEVRRRWSVLALDCAHATGRLRPGDLAVRVVVTARHRAEAFEACWFVMESVKRVLPIWKKEIFEDGSSAWIQHSVMENSK